MPGLADYIKKHGNVIDAGTCPALTERIEECSHTTAGVIIPIERIHIPSAFYLSDLPNDRIIAKVDEYNSYGDFLKPFKVKKTQTGYQLTDSYAQYLAAQELNLSECRCVITQ